MNIIKSSLICLVAAGTMFGTANVASATGSSQFESTISAPVTYPVKVEVVLSDDLAYRADHLPKSPRERGSSLTLNDGFSGNGYYGQRDLEDLVEKTTADVTEQLQASGITVSDSAPTTLRVTITDARPTHPTFTQMSKSSGLSMDSVAKGGAEFEADMLGPDGQSLGSVNYRWYQTNLDDFSGGATWSDARRAIGFFSNRLAGALS